ncbi:MAG TPA: flagellar biosynthesis protein FlhA [Rhodospirillaceae bacterium]|nr:flagellar biosynthesis protein FlhA [Rhodospirillaceae bacterium]
MATATLSSSPSNPDMMADMLAGARSGPTIFAVGVFSILMLLFFPVPKMLLDMLLATSIMASILVLMTSLFVQRPLEFTSFPTILLVITMFRLALNIASTRLILSHGHEGTRAAGEIIHAFGQLMAGDFMIGVVVFAIIVVVNFVVITKGSGRIAEVAARFTLDAMPGKQMAVDADLSAGLITEETARKRRKDLEDESSFFGAMDGAAKFVRGDAVASLIITFINIIGGLIIGSTSHGMELGEAAKNYTLLTIGEGLVGQITALIISFASGMIVTKAGLTGDTQKAVTGQLMANPLTFGIASFVMFIVAFLPNMPMAPFLLLGGGAGYMAYRISQKQSAQREYDAADMAPDISSVPMEPVDEPISTTLAIDTIRLELGYALLNLVNSEEGNRLTAQIKGLRKQMAQDLGFVLPSVRIQDNLQLDPNQYVIKIKEIEAGRGQVMSNKLLCMDPRGQEIALDGDPTTEPTFGLPAMWIDEMKREEALFRGYTVVDGPTVVTTHLTEAVRENMAELLSYSETQKLLDALSPEYQKLISDLVPSQITIGGLQRVMQTLLSERVSIRDLPTILEGVSESVSFTRNLGAITEHVRTRLSRQICESNTNAQGYVTLLTLSPEWEQEFAQSIVGDGEATQLSIAPRKLQEFITKVRDAYQAQVQLGENPVLLSSGNIRPYVRSIIERFRPQTTVMSQNEIHAKAKIKTLGQI